MFHIHRGIKGEIIRFPSLLHSTILRVGSFFNRISSYLYDVPVTFKIREKMVLRLFNNIKSNFTYIQKNISFYYTRAIYILILKACSMQCPDNKSIFF